MRLQPCFWATPSPIMRVVGQLDFTTVSKRTSSKSVHICLSITNLHPIDLRPRVRIWQQVPLLQRKRSGVLLHPKALTLDSSPSTSLVDRKTWLVPLRRPPLRADFEPGLCTLSINIIGSFIHFFFQKI